MSVNVFTPTASLLLLLAATTTVFVLSAADKKKMLHYVRCSGEHTPEKKCGCDTPEEEKDYVVNSCVTDGKGSTYRVEGCTPDGTDDIIMKTYENPTCSEGELFVTSQCRPVRYQGVKCQGKTITILSNCALDTCDSCMNLLEIASDDINTCFRLSNGWHYKLVEAVDCSGNPQSIKLASYDNAQCTGASTETTHPLSCTPSFYGKATCKKDESKVTLNICPNDDDDCSCGNGQLELTFNEPQYFGNDDEALVSSCEATEKTHVSVINKGRKIERGCHEQSGPFINATCYYMKTTATATIIVPTTTTTTSTTTSSTTTSSTTTESGNNSDNNNNNSSDISFVSVPSVTMLVLALCLLVCTHY